MSDSYDISETYVPSPSGGEDLPPKMERTRKSIDVLGVSASAFAKAMTKAFTQATAGGKQFDDVLKNMALKLSSMAVTNAFKPLAKSFSKGLSNIFKDIFNGGGTGGGDVSTGSDGTSAFFAKGGIKPFASGGVIGAPTYFPMSGGWGSPARRDPRRSCRCHAGRADAWASPCLAVVPPPISRCRL